MVIHYEDLILETSEKVYVPSEDSFLLAKSINSEDGSVLDIGTGCGIQALTAAKNADTVLGVDINPDAVELAKRNAKANNITNAQFKVSDLFTDVEGSFDLIIFNPPYLVLEAEDELDRAWAGGYLGVEVINRFIDSAGERIKPGGRLLLLVSSNNRVREVKNHLREHGFKLQVKAEQRIFFEKLYVLSAVFKESG